MINFCCNITNIYGILLKDEKEQNVATIFSFGSKVFLSRDAVNTHIHFEGEEEWEYIDICTSSRCIKGDVYLTLIFKNRTHLLVAIGFL